MSAKVYPSMVDAKQSETQSLSWFRPRGRTSSSGVLGALYCSALGVPVVGRLQARRERKRGFQVPSGVAEDIMGELENKCVVSSVALPYIVSSPFPLLLFFSHGGGVRPPFIGQGESKSHVCRAI
jgi:hypothetical protein